MQGAQVWSQVGQLDTAGCNWEFASWKQKKRSLMSQRRSKIFPIPTKTQSSQINIYIFYIFYIYILYIYNIYCIYILKASADIVWKYCRKGDDWCRRAPEEAGSVGWELMWMHWPRTGGAPPFLQNRGLAGKGGHQQQALLGEERQEIRAVHAWWPVLSPRHVQQNYL